MVKNAKFLLDMRVWSDASPSTNDPMQRDFSWYEQLTGIQIAQSFATSYTIPTLLMSGTITVQMPVTTGKYVFIKSDQPLAVKFNGSTNQLTKVTPTTPGTTSDGVMFAKMDFTSLTIDNLGSVIANVLVFIGG